MSPRRKNSTANNIATVTAIHQDAPSFPEETPETSEGLPVEPSHVSNDDRIAREREAFNDRQGYTPAPPVAAAPKPRQAARQPAQRRVSAEVVKAETRLLSLERRRQESLAHHDAVWAGKRAALLLSFPDDVHAALVAMGVLVEAEDLAEPGE